MTSGLIYYGMNGLAEAVNDFLQTHTTQYKQTTSTTQQTTNRDHRAKHDKQQTIHNKQLAPNTKGQTTDKETAQRMKPFPHKRQTTSQTIQNKQRAPDKKRQTTNNTPQATIINQQATTSFP